jgi:hypothetical protein
MHGLAYSSCVGYSSQDQRRDSSCAGVLSVRSLIATVMEPQDGEHATEIEGSSSTHHRQERYAECKLLGTAAAMQ